MEGEDRVGIAREGGVGERRVGGEDVDLVSAAGEGEVESEGVALEAAGEVLLRPAFDEKSDFELAGRWVRGEGELIP